MTDQLISFETAKLAKEKGFVNGSICDYRNNHLSDIHILNNEITLHTNNFVQRFVYEAPTQSLLQKWLREIHDIHMFLHPYSDKTFACDIVDNTYKTSKYIRNIKSLRYNTYEEALEQGLIEALKLIL